MLEALTINPWIFLILAALWFAAYMTGQALANTWRPMWQVIAYSILLGLTDRFLVFALYDGKLSNLNGYLADTLTLTVISLFAFRLSRARRMVTQYPWLYDRAGLFGLREKEGRG